MKQFFARRVTSCDPRSGNVTKKYRPFKRSPSLSIFILNFIKLEYYFLRYFLRFNFSHIDVEQRDQSIVGGPSKMISNEGLGSLSSVDFQSSLVVLWGGGGAGGIPL